MMYDCVELNDSTRANHCVVWNDCELSFIGQNITKIPAYLSQLYASNTRKLDVSYNGIVSLEGIDKFLVLEELVLDNNLLGDDVVFSFNPFLHTLSLNKNKFTDLESLLKQLAISFPRLKYLSLLGNSACPDQLTSSDHNEDDYRRYRRYAIHSLPRLAFLDSRPVLRRERKEAMDRGVLSRVVRLDNARHFEENGDASDAQSMLSPLPTESKMFGSHSGAFGRLKHRYTGRHSEGNRFIKNHEL